MTRGRDTSDEEARVRRMEINNQKQGRTGGETKKLSGIVGAPRHNPTKGGGVNRPLNSPRNTS